MFNLRLSIGLLPILRGAALWMRRAYRQKASSATLHITMIRLNIDRSDPTLLHDQVAADIRRAITDGEAKPGEKLPPAHDLAAVLGVNTNTVLRALRLLRDEGILEFRRGHGITVTGAAPKKSAVIAKAQELVQFARREGYRRDELVRLIESLP
jgi:GntR family transcriptional regulator